MVNFYAKPRNINQLELHNENVVSLDDNRVIKEIDGININFTLLTLSTVTENFVSTGTGIRIAFHHAIVPPSPKIGL